MLSREQPDGRPAQAINERFGALDGLVNAAGGNSPRATVSPTMSFFDMPEEAMRLVFDLNLLGTIMPCQILGQADGRARRRGDPELSPP